MFKGNTKRQICRPCTGYYVTLLVLHSGTTSHCVLHSGITPHCYYTLVLQSHCITLRYYVTLCVVHPGTTSHCYYNRYYVTICELHHDNTSHSVLHPGTTSHSVHNEYSFLLQRIYLIVQHSKDIKYKNEYSNNYHNGDIYTSDNGCCCLLLSLQYDFHIFIVVVSLLFVQSETWRRLKGLCQIILFATLPYRTMEKDAREAPTDTTNSIVIISKHLGIRSVWITSYVVSDEARFNALYMWHKNQPSIDSPSPAQQRGDFRRE